MQSIPKFYSRRITMRLPGGVSSPVFSFTSDTFTAEFNSADVRNVGLRVADPYGLIFRNQSWASSKITARTSIIRQVPLEWSQQSLSSET